MTKKIFSLAPLLFLFALSFPKLGYASDDDEDLYENLSWESYGIVVTNADKTVSQSEIPNTSFDEVKSLLKSFCLNQQSAEIAVVTKNGFKVVKFNQNGTPHKNGTLIDCSNYSE